MRFTVEQSFPASPERLWACFGQPDYVRRKYLALDSTEARLTRFDATARMIDVALERSVPVDRRALPRWARGFVVGPQVVRHRSRWRRVGAGTIEARLEIAPTGFPIRARGTGTIVAVGADASRMTIDWTVDADVPLLRERVERLFGDRLRAALEADHRFTLGMLAAGA